MSKLYVDEMRGNTSTTISIPSGQTLNVAGNLSSTAGSISGTPSFPDGAKVNTIKHTDGTTAMTIDSSGRVLQPTKPCFFAHFASGTFEINASNTTKTPLNATDVNIGNCWSTTNHLFTAPIAGVYQINWGFSIGVDGDSASYFASRLYKNGSHAIGSYHRNYNPPSQGGNQYGGHDCSIIQSFTAGETFYVIPQPSTTLTIKVERGTYMSGHLIG